MTKPASPTSFGFTDACDITAKPFADKDEALRAAFAKIDAEVRAAGIKPGDWLNGVQCEPLTELDDQPQWVRERHVRRALRLVRE